ncbi:MAG: PA0069 family radical SAM protein [Alphaproteobacteria bacterium]|nr:PA0069 family radical SAM protein [Alphaproteobacteria bacterium]
MKQGPPILHPNVPVNAERRHGRGATVNPSGRFEPRARVIGDQHYHYADLGWPAEGEGDGEPAPIATTVSEDTTKSIIARNNSPDIGFSQSINAIRGCEHGCIYCFARPTHEHFGLSVGLDFETKLFAKQDAQELLRRELANPRYRCEVIAIGTNTDPYQPMERKLGIMRRILEMLSECNHPVGIVTKSHLVTRDVDILADMAKRNLVGVHLSVTTLDRGLARRMEPRAATPPRRLEAIRALADAGVPVGIMVAPIIPGLNDVEIESILEAAKAAGARTAGKTLIRLPHGVKELFKEWLAEHAPGRAGHVMSLIRSVRDGRDNDPRFFSRMRGSGPYAEMIDQRFRTACQRLGFNKERAKLDTSLFKPPSADGQLALW